MKMLCTLRQRRLAQLSVEEASALPAALERHAKTCAECRDFLEDLRRIQRALPQAFAQEKPSSDFDSRLWAALQKQTQVSPRGWRSPYPVYVATMTMALSLAAIGYYSAHPKSEEVDKSAPFNPMPYASPMVAQAQTETPPLVTIKEDITPVRHRRTPKKRHSPSKIKAPLPAKEYIVKADAPKRQQITWTQVGSYYAAQGEYQDAATAYNFAYQQQRDPRLAFVAGQAAENAGDPIQALELFTKTLQPKPTDPHSDTPGKEKQNETSSPLHSIRNCSSFEREPESGATVS